MRGSVALEAIIISVVAIYFLIFAGKAVQAYGAKFAEDIDRAAWIRQSVSKIYASVRMLETCEVGSRDTIDVYVPEGGKIDLSGSTISAKIVNMNRNYAVLGGSEYSYSTTVGSTFTSSVSIPPGWARIRLERVSGGISVAVIRTGIR